MPVSLRILRPKHKAAIVCVSHLNKGGAGKDQALMRVTGSLAFVAAARTAYIVAKDKNNSERRLLLPIKNNIGNDQTGFAFAIKSFAMEGGIQTSRVEFESEPVTIRADEALIDNTEHSALEEAKEFLREILNESEIPVNTIKTDAINAGHTWATIKRAATQLGIKKIRTGFGKEGHWIWKLSKVLKESIDAHVLINRTFVEIVWSAGIILCCISCGTGAPIIRS